MIAPQTQSHIESLFVTAAKTTLIRDTAHEIAIQCESAGEPAAVKKPVIANGLLVITISSFEFRLLTLWNLPDSPALRSYYGSASPAVSAASFEDFIENFAETANLCCGAFNRSLSRHVTHLGMSAPYRLNSRCEEYVDALRPQSRAWFGIRINDGFNFAVTLCLCANRALEIDTSASSVAAEPATESGALELF
jgi:hypothetical protein